MALVAFVDETTSGDRSDAWHLEVFEERLTLREVIRRRVFQEVAEQVEDLDAMLEMSRAATSTAPCAARTTSRSTRHRTRRCGCGTRSAGTSTR